ncbi:hypothetical protein [Phytohabitans houttuyneae]|uniref:Uncharacterized protein n=1 Tax=Phytohabitans houttuyneae TaxID=1076126 RepID=A0A6V8K2X7_9ACTN|nr:hypothetical protein [Phytohabitans houttuyneae]GFJ79493.1 hypothetical protein Phou_036730 [Phytohabitans houttuyneae]
MQRWEYGYLILIRVATGPVGQVGRGATIVVISDREGRNAVELGPLDPGDVWAFNLAGDRGWLVNVKGVLSQRNSPWMLDLVVSLVGPEARFESVTSYDMRRPVAAS